VQLFIIPYGLLQVPWDDTLFLVITGSIASQLEDLSSQVLQDGSEVNWGASTDTLGIVTLLQETMDTTNRELETGL